MPTWASPSVFMKKHSNTSTEGLNKPRLLLGILMGKGLTHFQEPWLPPNTIYLAENCLSTPAWWERPGGLRLGEVWLEEREQRGHVTKTLAPSLCWLSYSVRPRASNWNRETGDRDAGGSCFCVKKELPKCAYRNSSLHWAVVAFTCLLFQLVNSDYHDLNIFPLASTVISVQMC